MYCLKCGKELPEGAQFCPHCGSSVSTPAAPPETQDVSGQEQDSPSAEQQTTPPASQRPAPSEPQQTTPPVPDEEVKCPKCGATGCVPQYKQNVSGGGYGCCQGVLGSLILGPLGLLCGACGRSTKTTNTLVWICPKCGHEFQVVTKESVFGNLLGLAMCAELSVAGLLMLLAGSELATLGGIVGIVCGLCGVIAAKIALPEDPFSYITEEQKQDLKKRSIIFGVVFIGSVLLMLMLS